MIVNLREQRWVKSPLKKWWLWKQPVWSRRFDQYNLLVFRSRLYWSKRRDQTGFFSPEPPLLQKRLYSSNLLLIFIFIVTLILHTMKSFKHHLISHKLCGLILLHASVWRITLSCVLKYLEQTLSGKNVRTTLQKQ